MRPRRACLLALAAFALPACLCAGELVVNETLELDGITRYWDYYLPDNADGPLPVVLLLHGGGQTKDQILSPTRVSPAKEWLQIADEEGVLIIVPNGVNRGTGLGIGTNLSWNDCRADNSTVSTEDDITFLSGVLDWAEANFDIDPARIYVTGSSNGGLMTYRVAQQLSHRVAAVAAFIANKPRFDACDDPEFPISVFICNGVGEEVLMPWDGGFVSGNPNAGEVISAPLTRDYWVDFNQIDTSPDRSTFTDIDPSDDSIARSLRYTGGSDGTEVEFIIVGQGGHVIPSIEHRFDDDNLALGGLGIQNHDFEGFRQAWNFLKRQRLGTTRSPDFAQWRTDNGLTGSLQLFPGTRKTAAEAYALGLDLLSPDPSTDQTPTPLTFERRTLSIAGADPAAYMTGHFRPRRAATGLTATLQRAVDGLDFSPANGALGYVETLHHDDGTATIVLREPEPILPPPDASGDATASATLYRVRISGEQ